ncbi:unnamed protein product [Caenorhabditis sp. 36 PRJEB53466]|nr:unnamed protein product [Caenorhabditis sp. 36 PRJEB53466]
MAYWRDDGDPVVFVDGVCSADGSETARTGYGLNFGPGDEKNACGTAIGSKSTLRTLLTGVFAALQKAVNSGLDKLIIRHRSQKLAQELEEWDKTGANDEHKFANRDLLQKIGRLRCELRVWIEEAEVDDSKSNVGFRNALLRAKQTAGMHSTASNPIDDEFWSRGVRVVHIHGTAVDRSRATNRPLKAGYGVWWGPGDARNEFGGVEGKQHHRRGQITAIWAAMSTAIDHHLDELIIRSKCEDMHSLINRTAKHRWSENSDHEDLTHRVDTLKIHFTKLAHEWLQSETTSNGQLQAGYLSRIHGKIIRAEVTLCGVRLPCGVARYGLYFGPDDARNESGRVCGDQKEFRAELMAAKRAMELVKKSGIRFLTIRTASSLIHHFFADGIAMWIKYQWMTGPDLYINADIGKEIEALRESMKIYVQKSSELSYAMDRVNLLAKTPQLDRVPAVSISASSFFHPDRRQECGYGIFWKDGDKRNQSVTVCGETNEIRCRYMAIRRALEVATVHQIPRLVIRIDCHHVFKAVSERNWEWKKYVWDSDDDPNRTLLAAIDELAAKMVNVEYELKKCAEAEYLADRVIRKSNAVLELKRKTENEIAKMVADFNKQREWGAAPLVEVSGRIPAASWFRQSKKGQRFADSEQVEQPIVKIRWANSPTRDADILLPDFETLYSAEVKAVLYGIIQAIDYKETKIRLQNSNEVVVKVANGRYKASKESARFHLISQIVNRRGTKSNKTQLKAKIEKLGENDKGIRRMATVTMTEAEFFEKYKDSIETLKNYN